METHVSSTTADVPETQEVIGSHGNVELVIVVEKLDEEQPQKADSNSQDNIQPMIHDNSTLSNQSKKDGLPQNSPSKQELLQESASKQTDVGKSVQPLFKMQQTKQSTQATQKSEIQTQNKLCDKPDSITVQSTPPKELITHHVDVDSTSIKDNLPESNNELSKEKDITITIEKEASNDSQMEINSDISEKEHNKSISRELKSLINSAKESKIINECTKLTSKTRKSRTALDTSNTNLNSSTEADSMIGNRRSSNNSQKSNCSEKSDKVGKRSMRSQNPEFVNKVKQFLNSVTGKFQRTGDSDASLSASDEELVSKSVDNTDSTPCTPKNRSQTIEQAALKVEENSNKLRSDAYCWRCHWSIDMADEEKTPQPPMRCTVCPRSFHYRCLTGVERPKLLTKSNWVCPECMTVLHAESSETRSPAMKKTTLGMLCELLKFALQRMTEVNGVEPFLQPVDRTVFPDYDKCVVHPMDLSLMRTQISEGLYGSTESFLADAYWILHNSIIFNALQSKLTAAARALVRSCRAEMGEIEACPECYAAAHARRPTWFTDVCSTPHLVLWAKLKGFPYWPAKAMSVSHAGLVDVRFFGAHDRAWVPARDCFLYSEKDPNNFRTKRQDIIDSMQEAAQHIRNISRKYGKFVYAPFRTQFEPSKLTDQLKMMIPSYEAPIESPVRDRTRRRSRTPALVMKSRSRSIGSKDGLNVGDEASDSEGSPVESKKMNDSIDKIKTDSPIEKTQNISNRKRRRSDVQEGTVASTKEKRKRDGSGGKEQDLKKNETQLVSSSKETSQPTTPAGDDKLVEPMDTLETPECQSSNLNVLPSSNKSVDSPKLDKATAKNISVKGKDDVSLQPNKTLPNNTQIKFNDTEKKNSTEANSLPQNVRNSRSNKSLNNSETMEIDISSSDSISSNKIDKTPNNPPCKLYSNSNKETDTPIKVNEKEKEPGLIELNVNNLNANANESSTPNKLNEKAQVPETSALKQAAESENGTKVKNIENDKTSEPLNKNTGKEKLTEIASKDKVKEKTKGAVALNIKNAQNEKNNETRTLGNKKTDKEVSSPITLSKNVAKEKSGEIHSTEKTPRVDKASENMSNTMDSVDKDKSISGKNTPTPKAGTSKGIKSKEDTSPATTSRKATKSNASPGPSGMPTISSVRSLSAPTPPTPSASSATPAAPATPARTANTATTAKTKTTQVTVEVNADSSIFTPTSTDNVRNMKEAVNKLQKLRTGFEQPQVGRVGVRAFARMTSPPEKQAKTSDMQIEIKTEPMDFEELDVTQATTSVLDSLRPRATPSVAPSNLREVRISKVVASPTVAKKVVKAADVRPRAKKTFPQPKKSDDGRAELTNKNSMVYIPIQPPMSQAPVRAALKPAATQSAMPAPRAPLVSASVGITSMAPPLLPMAPPPPPPPVSLSAAASSAPSSPAGSTITAAAIIGGPSFPTVPTTVHTVPLITSVNGQWTFSLQPVMSVGGVDNITTPMVNGVGERLTPTPVGAGTLTPATLTPAAIAPAGLTALSPAPAPAPAPSPAPGLALPALVPTSSPSAAAANAINRTPDTSIGEPPRMQQRPLRSPLAASTPVGDMPPPSAAGPLTAKLNQNSVKLADFFRTLLEDSLEQVEEPAAQVTALRLQLEQLRWQHQHELAELRHTHELLLVEVRAAMEKERARAVAEARRLAHQELDAAVKHAKSKQWCANCSQEAQFYCCWNTSYCDYPCQRAHWAQHYGSCTQQRTSGGGGGARSDLASQTPTDDIPVRHHLPQKTTAAPTLTVGGKVTSRIVNSEQTQKSPIVVSVMDEATRGSGHSSPLLANKQLMNSEECGAKRVVTSGGYLIVGAAAGPVVAAPAPRRAPAAPTPAPAPSPHIDANKQNN
ncbi:uncharacterized protein isoform X2 [Choristoneura fumiferana]|uniref:uncharacterized protein isoform X2 n=1 Tax=Choristoneura fumiferana TaxID=7141 RepID=UPI003D15ABD6